ncbi:hypothetical protein OIU79_023906 [Salix purpurea]|uniref:Uncharacterized protein n=1 Tax=Salix purpurea TaxID=77065 RepID=A0A9Q0WA92_SALPP|nr:hypothetical protein OIU79_023906 [Salix purpurea]
MQVDSLDHLKDFDHPVTRPSSVVALSLLALYLPRASIQIIQDEIQTKHHSSIHH